MASVVEDVGLAATAYLRHHVRHHRAQASPRHDLPGGHAWEALLHPVHQRPDAISADVAVDAIELGGACHPEAVFTQTAGHQLGLIVQQADRGCGSAAGLVQQIHGDGIALDGVHIHPVAQLAGQSTAANTGTNHDAVIALLCDALGPFQFDTGFAAVAAHRQHVLAVLAVHAQALTSLRQALREPMNVSCGITLGVVAAVVATRQRGLDGRNLLWRHSPAFQASGGQQFRDASGVFKALAVTIDVQDAFAPVVKRNALGLSPGEQVLARGDGQSGCLDGVGFVARNAGDELGEPRDLVPAGPWIDQQRRITAQHPLQAFDKG